MKDMKTVASYIATRYQAEKGERIDEMKLHKLMYLAQRESLAQTDKPLYEAKIEGWRLGPVLPALRSPYKDNKLGKVTDLGEDQAVVDAVYNEYANWESLKLSYMTHEELCWRKSRKGIPPSASSSNPIDLEDIRLDAIRSLTLSILDKKKKK